MKSALRFFAENSRRPPTTEERIGDIVIRDNAEAGQVVNIQTFGARVAAIK
ncbi:MAG: hypothetical protein WCS65_11580 [Verrucomicrobiae bacterium]